MTPEACIEVLQGWVQSSDGNLTARLTVALRQLMLAGVINPGDQLPSERALCIGLGVSRPTVSAALNELRASGLLESRQGSGTRVANKAGATGEETTPFTGMVLGATGINLAAAVPFDATHIPDLSISTAEILEVEPSHGIAPLGLSRLRRAAANRLTHLGLDSGPEQIVVTAGAHAGIKLIFESLIKPNSTVIVDEYTYGGMVTLANQHAANLIGIPRDNDGLDPQALNTTLQRTKPALVIVALDVHSPSGSTTTTTRRAEIADVLNAHDVPVAIDETYSELTFGGRTAPFARSLTQPNITIESISKVSWGGLRTGWLRATPELVEVLTRRVGSDLGLGAPSQLIAARLLENQYESFLTQRRSDLELRAAHLREELGTSLPEWTIHRPVGGLTTWIHTTYPHTGELARRTAQAGLLIAPGHAFHHKQQTGPWIRLCHDRPRELLTEGTRRLSNAA